MPAAHHNHITSNLKCFYHTVLKNTKTKILHRHTHKPKEHPQSLKRQKKTLPPTKRFHSESMRSVNFGVRQTRACALAPKLTSYWTWENDLTFPRPFSKLKISNYTYPFRVTVVKEKNIRSWYIIGAQ